MPSPARAGEDLARDESAGEIETVASFDGPMPTGVTVSHSGRIFICDPKWSDKVDFTIAEVRGGPPKPVTMGSDRIAIAHDRSLWPDTLSVARDGHLYFTANQLHRQARYHEGKDLRQRPYVLFRTKIDAGPVRLTADGPREPA
jgi:hypothetical protein